MKSTDAREEPFMWTVMLRLKLFPVTHKISQKQKEEKKFKLSGVVNLN